jgi:hypothetical protein
MRRWLAIWYDGDNTHAKVLELGEDAYPGSVTPADVDPRCELLTALVEILPVFDGVPEVWIGNGGQAKRAHPSPIDLAAVEEDPDWTEFVAWARKIGGGFHPDTAGADYDPPLDDPAAYDAAMGAAFGARGTDPYEVGLAVEEVMRNGQA